MAAVDIQSLLPFHVNGTLADDERRLVDEALRGDADLAHQAELLGRLRERMQALPMPPSPAEFGLARLMRDIAAPPPARRLFGRPQLALMGGLSTAAAIAVGLTFVFSPPRTEPGYTQASGVAGDGDLGVTFVPGTTVQAMQSLLQQHDLVIADGPSAIGLFWLDLPEGADAAAMAETLRRNPGPIESVSLPE